MASSSVGEIAKFFTRFIDFEDAADFKEVVVADNDVEDCLAPETFATAPIAGEDEEVNVATLGDVVHAVGAPVGVDSTQGVTVLLTTTLRFQPWPSKLNRCGFASMSSRLRRIQSTYSS